MLCFRLPAALGLVALGAVAAQAQNAAVSIDVDAASNRRSIDPRVYGLAYATPAQLSDLNVPLNRLGGNNTSRYNWQINADNRGSDWYFESVPYGSSTAGEVGDTFIQEAKSAGAQPMLTIPMVGWVAKLGASRSKLASFSIAKYGAQTGNDWQWFADAGNGVSQATGQAITGNNANDANVPATSAFQNGYIQHIVGRWGQASAGGLRYFILDNEPSIWHSTHRDVHPTGATMDEMRDKIIDYSAKVKAADPGALVVAPEEWGWSGYFWSGYDQQYFSQHGWGTFPDRDAHGGAEYLPWLLDQLHQRDVATGQRVLDVFTVHYYPQGGEFSPWNEDLSSAMQLRRNRSTRSLWDPSYTDETWINDTVRLVPRLRDWVNTHYPGTEIGITEYNWGAEAHINGATTQADILGIFGREGLDLAARWTTPDTATPTYKAIRMYRNYDGNKSTFGDVSVSAGGTNPDQVAVFAAERSGDAALTIMVVNKVLSGNTPATIHLAGFSPSGPAQVWQLRATNAIARLADVAVSAGALSATLPPQSITLFVLPSAPVLSIGDATLPEPNAGSASGVFTVSLSAPASGSVTVDYATANGSATAGADYTATSGTLSFAPGETTKTLAIAVNGDALAESAETFHVALTNPSGAAVADADGVGTIVDSAAVTRLQFALAAQSVAEGAGKAIVTVKRVGTTTGSVSVAYAASNGTATSADFGAANGTLTFGPGVVSRTLAVPITQDTLVEGKETVLLALRAPGGGAGLGTPSTSVLTINDDDLAGAFSFSAASSRVSRSAGTATLTVRRLGGALGTASVTFATANGTATAGVDYTASSTVLTFAPGVVTSTVAITLTDNGTPVPDRTLTVALSNPTGGAKLGTPASATLTLVSGDSVVQFGAAAYRAPQTALRAVLGVTRSAPLTGTATVAYATSNGTATAGQDYTAVAGTLTFGPGIALRTFAVPLLPDASVEADQTLLVQLSAPTGGVGLGLRASTVLTIGTANPALGFSALASSVRESAGRALITVRRAGPTAPAVSVNFATANGTALAGSDYTSTSGTLNFGAGVVAQTFWVPITADTLHEAPETILLRLQAPSAGAVLAASANAVLTITDDDAAGVLQFALADMSVREAGSEATISVSRGGGLAAGMSVDYATANGTALAGTHYQTATGSLTFAAGEVTKTFVVPILDDLAAGPNRMLRLQLTNARNGAVLGANTTATLWIVAEP